MIEWATFDDEITDSTLRAMRWLMGGAAGGLFTHWVINGSNSLTIAIQGIVLFLLSLGLDLGGKVLAGTFGEG